MRSCLPCADQPPSRASLNGSPMPRWTSSGSTSALSSHALPMQRRRPVLLAPSPLTLQTLQCWSSDHRRPQQTSSRRHLHSLRRSFKAHLICHLHRHEFPPLTQRKKMSGRCLGTNRRTLIGINRHRWWDRGAVGRNSGETSDQGTLIVRYVSLN
jgi:hypothetical protein